MPTTTQSKTGLKKPGSGRTKGAVSIVSVPLKALLKVFASHETHINVSRKFVEQFGIPYTFLEGQHTPEEEKPEPVSVQPAKKAPTIKSRNFK